MTGTRRRAAGTAGHASIINSDNAIGKLAEAVLRLSTAQWPVSLTSTVETLLERIRQLAELPRGTDPNELAAATGVGAAYVSASLQNVGNVTMFNAG